MPRHRNHKRDSSSTPKSVDDIPLAQPDQEKRNAKTLLDIASEHRHELLGSQGQLSEATGNEIKPSFMTASINPDGSLTTESSGTANAEGVGVLGDTILYSISLSMVHFTFDVLVHNQYAENIIWIDVLSSAGLSLLLLLPIVYILHPRADTWWAQTLFVAFFVTAGCYIASAGYKYPYLAVMKQAPPLGTLLIWSAVEAKSYLGLLAMLIVWGYCWWGGYSLLS